MKQLLLATLLLSGAVATMTAQDLFFVDANGEMLTNGQTYEFKGYETYPQGNLTEVFIDPALKLVSTTDAMVNVRATSNVDINLCAGGNCESGNDVQKENVTLTANQELNLEMDFSETTDDFDSYEIPAVTVELSAWYVDDPSSMITLTVQMGSAAAVETIAAAFNSVTFQGNALNYDVNGASQLSLYSLSGKVVMQKNISGAGSLDLDGLSKGVYLYRLTGKNGKAVKTSKIIIK